MPVPVAVRRRAAGQGHGRKPPPAPCPGAAPLLSCPAGPASLGPASRPGPATAPREAPAAGGVMSAPRAATPGPGSGAVPGEALHGRALELELGSSTQTSHRLLAYSDALLSIIATVMVSPGLPGSVGTGGGAGSREPALREYRQPHGVVLGFIQAPSEEMSCVCTNWAFFFQILPVAHTKIHPDQVSLLFLFCRCCFWYLWACM